MRRVASQHTQPRPVRRRGFSLLELVMVLAILGTVAGLAAPRVADVVLAQRVATAADRLEQDLRLTRDLAVGTSTSQSVSLSTADHAYTRPDHLAVRRSDDQSQVSLAASPHRVEIAKVTGPMDVTFDGFGQAAAQTEIVLAAGRHTAIVRVLSPSGVVVQP
jgi:prepilin-type N-terminal cleavage/methylation domain-containing protein